MEIMKFSKFISYFKISESFKENELNNILDKISKKIKLTQKEEKFLSNYDKFDDSEIKDYRLLSLQSTFESIKKLLDNDKKIICNISDRNGKIGIEIDNVFNDYEKEACLVSLSNGDKFKLKDNFSYNIIYNFENDSYSLETEDEFFEKLPINND